MRLETGAHIDGPYRYRLWRTWDSTRPPLLWVMLNPSTADASLDDPTMRRVVGFTKQLGTSGGVEVVNLFAHRSAQPGDLLAADDPVGPENDAVISEAILRASASSGFGLVMAAWGAITPRLRWRLPQVFPLLHGPGVVCLGVTKHGYPRHPLYVPSASLFSPYYIPTRN